jgi:hypothetical protein
VSALIAVAAALLVIALLLALAFGGIWLLALLCQATWPVRWLLHLVRARIAVWRELDRSRAKWMHPASR